MPKLLLICLTVLSMSCSPPVHKSTERDGDFRKYCANNFNIILICVQEYGRMPFRVLLEKGECIYTQQRNFNGFRCYKIHANNGILDKIKFLPSVQE